MSDIQYFLNSNISSKKFIEKRIGSVAFWSKDNKIIELSDTHIKYIIDNPKIFGLTKKDIEALYDLHNERYGVEGLAREDIIKTVARFGWIRIRHYVHPIDYWSIQCDDYKKRKRNIIQFCDWAIDKEFMGFNDDIKILAYDTNDYIEYGFRDGGVSALYEAWKKNKEMIIKIKTQEGMTSI